MVEHNLSVVADLSDTITVLQRGQILAEGSYEEVSGNPEVREAYMGTGAAGDGSRPWLRRSPARTRCCGSRASMPSTASRTSCTASTSACARARS